MLVDECVCPASRCSLVDVRLRLMGCSGDQGHTGWLGMTAAVGTSGWNFANSLQNIRSPGVTSALRMPLELGYRY